jgi:hypothetical protein
MITTIRPFRLFSAIDAPPAERVAQIALPYRPGEGGVSMLETSLIITAARLVDARRVFEFGTFLGNTTLNLALNTPDNAEILTLDLDDDPASEPPLPADARLARMHREHRKSLAFRGSPVAHKITTLTGNSREFDFFPWRGSIDLVFVDGGHDFATIDADTQNALEMYAAAKPSCILWHDYRNAEYSAVTYYLDDLSNRLELFHVGDTMLCVWFNDPFRTIVPHLLGERVSQGQAQRDSGDLVSSPLWSS